MSLFSKLEKTEGLTILRGATMKVSDSPEKPRRFAVIPAELEHDIRPADHVLLAVHYFTHVLARFPREDSELDRFGMELRQMLADIIEQGIWPGSDLLDFAGIADRAKLVESDKVPAAGDINVALMRSAMGDGLDLVMELPDAIDNDTLILSAIVMLQAVTNAAEEREIELLDKELRYLMTYIGEGADYGSLPAAKSLANRAFREAGGETV